MILLVENMTQRTIDVLFNAIYSKAPKKNYITENNYVYHIDGNWSLYIKTGFKRLAFRE